MTIIAPNVKNASSPLRIWRNYDLQVVDNEGVFQYPNPLIADFNKGPANPEDAYKYHIRLPPSYTRNGDKWVLAKLATQNFSYAGKEDSFQKTSSYVNRYFPINYDLSEGDVIPLNGIYYLEDWLTSNIKKDTSSEFGWEYAEIRDEQEVLVPLFEYFSLIEYEPFNTRIALGDGEWKGSYYIGDDTKGKIIGEINQDLAAGTLVPTFPRDFDASEFKYPRLSDDYESNVVNTNNYTIGYAYFAADLSAADDIIFEGGDCIALNPKLTDNSNYIQHEGEEY